MSETCDDCQRPLANDIDGIGACPEKCAHCDALCWRRFHDDRCQSPIDWRARCLAAEAALRSATLCSETTVQLAGQAEALTAERDQLKAEVERLRLENYDIRRWADSPVMSVEIYKGEAQRLRDERDQIKRDLAEALDRWEASNRAHVDNGYDEPAAETARIAELRKRAGL